jgi:hypothetical protein
VNNGCFTCPIITSTGAYQQCFSLLQLGLGLCDSQSLVAMIKACNAIGATPGLDGSGIKCEVFTTGTNQSQFQACAALTPTKAPSSGSLLYPSLVTVLLAMFMY